MSVVVFLLLLLSLLSRGKEHEIGVKFVCQNKVLAATREILISNFCLKKTESFTD